MAYSTLHLQRQCCEVHKKIFLEALKSHFQHDLVFAKLKRRLEVNGLYQYYEKSLELHFTDSPQTSICLPTDQTIALSNDPSSLLLYCSQKYHWHLFKRQGRKLCPQTHFPGGKLLPDVSDCDQHMIKHWCP